MDLVKPLLVRIKYDQHYAKAEFKIGYYEPNKKDVIIVPIYRLILDPKDHYTVQIVDYDDKTHMLPMYLIKDVYRNSKLVWHRDNLCVLPFPV